MAKARLQTFQNPDGTFTTVFDDGSTVVFDSYGNIQSQNDTPNPLLVATLRSGDEEGAARMAVTTSNENARRFDAGHAIEQSQVDNQRRQIDQTYQVAMMNARTTQEQAQLTREYQRAQVDLAKSRLAFDERASERDFGQRQREFGVNTGLAQAGLAKGMIDTAANLSGPANVFEAYDLNRGYGSMQETPAFLSALRNNTALRAFGAQGGAPDPKTLDSLMAKMSPGYASSPEARTTENALAAAGDVALAGGHKVGAGVLESLNEDEVSSLLSGIGKSGFNRGAFLSDWRRSRIGQNIGSRAA